MSVEQVIHRIGDIQRQFGTMRARSGYAAAQAAASEETAVRNDGVIVGRMGADGPTVAGVGVLQEQTQLSGGLHSASQSGAANLSSPLPHLDRVSGYGMRLHPVHGDHRMHHGVDLDAPAGTPVAAISDGIVSFAGERGGYGNLVVIDHGGGFETRYAHQEHLSVTEGDLVRAGDVLGAVGSTGVSTGPHLHFEVRRDGESVDPEPWLRAL